MKKRIRIVWEDGLWKAFPDNGRHAARRSCICAGLICGRVIDKALTGRWPRIKAKKIADPVSIGTGGRGAIYETEGRKRPPYPEH